MANLTAGIVLTFVLPAFAIASAMAQTTAPAGPRRILFVGDSFTYVHGGINTHVAALAAAAQPPRTLTADKSAFGGAFLHRLWDIGAPVQAINTGAYDTVVLQEDIPETTIADFREYALKFVAEVRKNNARPILFMAWAYPRLGWISMTEIAKAHRDAARELNVDVAPVGLAWQEASKQRPGMNMYAEDREHPSIHGMYLAACVMYSTIYNHDPGGLAYAPAGVTSEEAAFLQKVAAAAVQEYREGRL